MFHWICPECGQECSPTSRDCPSCYPNATHASAAEPAGAAQLESAPAETATAVLDSPVLTLSEVTGQLSSLSNDAESLAVPLLALAGQVEISTETSWTLPGERAGGQMLLDVAASALVGVETTTPPMEVIAAPTPTAALVPVRSSQMAVAPYRPRHDAGVVDITSNSDYRYQTTIPSWVITVFIAVTVFLACVSILLYLVLGRART